MPILFQWPNNTGRDSLHRMERAIRESPLPNYGVGVGAIHELPFYKLPLRY